MAPNLSEDEIDDVIFFARAGESKDLEDTLQALAARENVSTAEILNAAKDEGKSTSLHMATGNGHLEIVKLLVAQFNGRPKEEKQTFLDAPNEFGNTGLHWASLGGHLETVKFLLEHGASAALANDKNYVPLDLASFNGHVAVVEYFLSLSSNIETENQTGLNGAAEALDLGEDADADNGKGSSNST